MGCYAPGFAKQYKPMEQTAEVAKHVSHIFLNFFAPRDSLWNQRGVFLWIFCEYLKWPNWPERNKMNKKNEMSQPQPDSQTDFIWKSPKLVEFVPLQRYHGYTCPTPPVSTDGGDSCTVQEDE